jgi:hypothetical protein
MSDDKEALITTSKESGLGGKPFTLDKQQQPHRRTKKKF